MGNSPSRTTSKGSVSGPYAQHTRSRSMRSGPASPGGLAPNPGSHHRSRSVNPPARVPELAPPPPYTPRPTAVNNTPIDAPVTFPLAPGASSELGSSQNSSLTSPPESSSSRTGRRYDIRTPIRQQTAEDALETLRKFDTVLIVDDSSSMNGELWEEATRALSTLADTAGRYDTDGIDIHFLNSELSGVNIKNAADVKRLFRNIRPSGYTPLGSRLEELLRDYLRIIENANKSGNPGDLKRIKPVNYIVITDGEPTDDPAGVIAQAAKRLDAGNFPMTQIGIQFVQIGNSPRATEYLQALDDELSTYYKIRDIVDTTIYDDKKNTELTGDMLIKILLGGINRRVDRGGASIL